MRHGISLYVMQFLSSDAETWKGQCISYWVRVGNCPPPPPSWLQLPGFLSVNYFSTNKFSVKLHCNSNFRNISLDSGEVTLPFHLCFFKRKFLTVREDPFFDRFSCSGKQTGGHRFWFPLKKSSVKVAENYGDVPYFFGYKKEIFPSKTIPKI